MSIWSPPPSRLLECLVDGVAIDGLCELTTRCDSYSVRARFRDDGARNDAQYMSLLGDTLRTQRTAKPCSAIWEASRAAGEGRSFSGGGNDAPTAF